MEEKNEAIKEQLKADHEKTANELLETEDMLKKSTDKVQTLEEELEREQQERLEWHEALQKIHRRGNGLARCYALSRAT